MKGSGFSAFQDKGSDSGMKDHPSTHIPLSSTGCVVVKDKGGGTELGTLQLVDEDCAVAEDIIWSLCGRIRLVMFFADTPMVFMGMMGSQTRRLWLT